MGETKTYIQNNGDSTNSNPKPWIRIPSSPKSMACTFL
jgi:hypothetical protein